MPQAFRIKTNAFSASDLLLESFSCSEALSTLTEITTSLLSPRSDLDADKILGKPVTIEIELRNNAKRHFNGFVSRFALTGASGKFFRYQAIVRPWFWFLTRTTDCRIFQDMKVPDIVKTVFDDHPIAVHDFKLFRDYPKWDYCVQYRESDFNFVSRLLEYEGIYYRFEHSDGQHKLILLDSISAHDPQPEGADSLPFFSAGQQPPPNADLVSRWAMTRSVQPGKFAIKDFDFELPPSKLLVEDQKKRKNDLSDFETFDYPGGFTKDPEGVHYLENRRDEAQSRFEVFSGATNAQSVHVGFTFKLRRHPRADQNAEYLVTGTDIQASNGSLEGGDSAGAGFHCEISALLATQQFRPLRRAKKGWVHGPQTAVVVGKEGEEIHTDKFGRVRVQFHWDRLGKKNEKSSCLIRVAQIWAGKNFGGIFIPRVGHEVIVDFLEGDPDQPIITGCVYNGDNMPPWKLPDHATQSGVLTRSSKGGVVANANMIRFEDKKGAEQVALHAERNLDTSVEADETHSVGHDRHKTIHHDEVNAITNNRTKDVGVNETTTIGNHRIETVGANETITIGANRTESVSADEKVKIGGTRHHKINLNDLLEVGVRHDVLVGAEQVIDVGSDRLDTIGGDVTQTIGGNFAQTVTGNVKVTALGTMMLSAAGGVTIVAPGGTKFVDFQFTKIGGTNQAAYNMNVEGYVLHNETSAIATAQKGVSVEASLVRNEAVTALLNKASIRLLSTDSAVLDKAGIMLKKASLTLFG
ncbi:MAG TPA: type VI secretion system tip protein TssI/VgrG [Caldimonas sp.]